MCNTSVASKVKDRTEMTPWLHSRVPDLIELSRTDFKALLFSSDNLLDYGDCLNKQTPARRFCLTLRVIRTFFSMISAANLLALLKLSRLSGTLTPSLKRPIWKWTQMGL